MGRSNVNAVQVGNDTRISLCSQSHGRVRVPLAQTCTFTPKMASGMVGEFDNRFPVMTYGTYEGVTVAFEHFLADNGDINAMIMDTNPFNSVQPMLEAVAVMNQERVWVNYYSPTLGYQYGFDYANRLVMSGNPNSQTIKDPAKITKSFEGAVHFGAVGKTGQVCSLQYVRFVGSAPAFKTPDDILMVGGIGTFPNAPVAIPLPTQANMGVTQNYVDAYKNSAQINGNPVQDGVSGQPVDFTISGTTFTPYVAPNGTTDVYEVMVCVQPSSPIL